MAASPIHKDDWDHLFVQCPCDAISSPIGQPILLCTNEIKSIMSIISQPQTPNKDNVSRFFRFTFLCSQIFTTYIGSQFLRRWISSEIVEASPLRRSFIVN